MSAIIRIISVVDTRQYDEQGDRFVPIPGSGNVRGCDRCGRDHEVHATVELDDGATAFEVSALVPAWFVAKLDTRPGWAKRGERCPEGQRPW